MKKKLFLLLLIIATSLFCNAQAPPRWIWAEAGGSGYGYGVGLEINRDTLFIYGRIGGTLTLGNLSINGGTVPYVGMYDTAGTTHNNGIWLSDNYTNSGFAYADAMAIDKEDNTYITSCDGSGNGVYIQRYNRYGTSKWLTDEPNSNCRGYGVAADNRGNVYSAGNYGGYSGQAITFGSFTLPYGGSAWAGYVTKQDTATGAFKWATRIAATSGSNNNYIVAGRCAADNQGNVYVAGSYQGTPTFYSIDSPAYNGPAASAASTANNWGDLFVAEYDSNGDLIRVITAQDAGAPYNSYGYAPSITVDSCDNVYVAGIFQNTATFGSITVTSGAPSGGYNFFVAKWNALAQNWEWVQTGASAANNSPTSLTLDRNSDIYVAGYYGGTPFSIGDTTLNSGNTFVAKYANSLGALIWVANATASGAGGIGVDSQKYVYLSGNMGTSATFGPYTVSTSQNGTWLAKLDTFPVRTIVPVVAANYCPGETTTLPYTVTGSFGSTNTFTAQLSNDSGSFINPQNIGVVTSQTNGTITITIPSNLPPGSNYLIRVISSSPAGSSYASGCSSYYINNVYINDFYVTIGSNLGSTSVTPDSANVCSGGSVQLTASGGTSYLWSNGDTSSVINVNPTTDTSYIVTVSNGTCTGNDTVKIKVNAAPPLTVQPLAPTICSGSSTTLSVPSSGTNYNWTPSTSLNTTTGDSVLASPTITTTYTVTGTDSLGCTVTGSDVVSVNTVVPLTVQPPSPAVDCNLAPIILSVPTSGKDYVWSPSTYLNKTTGDTVTASPAANFTYTVTGVDSSGCNVSGTEVIDIISGPSKPTITKDDSLLISSSTQSNQWLRNDSTLLGATNQDYTVTIPGYYQVIVSNPANGCSTTSDSVFASGIDQLSALSNQLSIYPNPFNNNIFINISSSALDIKNWNLEIIDVLGRTLYTRSSLNYSNDIDLSTLPSGVYFITIINDTARAVFPVVKQN